MKKILALFCALVLMSTLPLSASAAEIVKGGDLPDGLGYAKEYNSDLAFVSLSTVVNFDGEYEVILPSWNRTTERKYEFKIPQEGAPLVYSYYIDDKGALVFDSDTNDISAAKPTEERFSDIENNTYNADAYFLYRAGNDDSFGEEDLRILRRSVKIIGVMNDIEEVEDNNLHLVYEFTDDDEIISAENLNSVSYLGILFYNGEYVGTICENSYQNYITCYWEDTSVTSGLIAFILFAAVIFLFIKWRKSKKAKKSSKVKKAKADAVKAETKAEETASENSETVKETKEVTAKTDETVKEEIEPLRAPLEFIAEYYEGEKLINSYDLHKLLAEGGEMTVGSNSNNTITVKDIAANPLHYMLFMYKGVLSVMDCGSEQGTYLYRNNSFTVLLPNTAVTLQYGDALAIGASDHRVIIK